MSGIILGEYTSRSRKINGETKIVQQFKNIINQTEKRKNEWLKPVGKVEVSGSLESLGNL